MLGKDSGSKFGGVSPLPLLVVLAFPEMKIVAQGSAIGYLLSVPTRVKNQHDDFVVENKIRLPLLVSPDIRAVGTRLFIVVAK